VSVDGKGRAALVANYDSGSIALLPIDERGALGAPSIVVQHTGHGPNGDRQAAPHAHCILAHPRNRFAFAADLGTDRVLVYELDVTRGTLHHRGSGDASMHPGAGPRHIAFHPALPFLFVTNELDSTVATLRFDREAGALTLLSVTSTLPIGWQGENYPADVHVAPAGDVVYVSNRGHDSIAVFSINRSTGALKLRETTSTNGSWPRNFAVDASDRWVVVANQKSNSIIVLERDRVTGRLTRAGGRLEVPSPACVRFGPALH
jgi:6-phosphogluconolactonase